MAEEKAPELQASPGRDVFISHASHDKAVAESVCIALESAGLVCWIAPRDVVPGESFAGAIVHAIDATKVIVLVLSEHAATSQHVLREVERASSKRHPVIALRIDTAPMPADLEYFLNTSQWLDANGTGVKHALPRLVDAVRVALTQPFAARRVNPHPSPVVIVRHRPSVMIVAFGVFAAAALGYFLVDKFSLASHAAGEQPPAFVSPAAPVISDKSIAVLPFVDMSEKHDQEYFCDGMSEELIDRLVRTPELKVIARTSSFQFKGRNEDVRAIASKLAVAHVLEGSVRKSGQILRVTTQLIRATDGMHLWSKTYDRKLGDVFKMQDDIATAVAEVLSATLNVRTSEAAAAPDLEAYNLVLQGNVLKSRFNASDLEKAEELYRQAIAIDPRYALAWARLGSNYFNQYFFSDSANSVELLDKARKALNRALELDPNLIWGYYTLSGIGMTVDWNWNAVTAAMVKMYEINPNNRELLASAQADVAGLAGDFDYVLRVRLANLITDPINARNLFDLANAQLSMRQFQTALMTNQRLIDLEPRYGGVWTQRAWILLWSGRFPEAFEAIEHESDPEVKLSFATIAHWRQGQSRQSTKDMQRLIQLSGTKHPFDVAEAAGCRGDANAAFEWLDRAFSSRDPGITGIKSDFCLDGLRNDARYRRLVTRVGLDRLIYKSEDLRRLAGSPRSDAKP